MARRRQDPSGPDPAPERDLEREWRTLRCVAMAHDPGTPAEHVHREIVRAAGRIAASRASRGEQVDQLWDVVERYGLGSSARSHLEYGDRRRARRRSR